MPTDYIVAPSDIERETGFSNDLLRKWRQRYGFPLMETSPENQVGYSRKTISHILLIKRLIENGFRPSQIVGKSFAEITRLIKVITDEVSEQRCDSSTKKLIGLLKKHDLDGFKTQLKRIRTKSTLSEFVQETIVPLVNEIGNAWSRGEIEVYHEHICSNIIMRILQGEIASTKPKHGFPTILFATPPDEHHVLGLLMAEAVLADHGATSINMGSHIPINELKMAANSFKANIVALSFSFAYSSRRVRPTIVHLRHLLPTEVELWVGGSGARIIRRAPKGVRLFSDIHDAVGVLHHSYKKDIA